MKTKAIFLLIIFLLNTAVGFACAVGMVDEGHQAHALNLQSKIHQNTDRQFHHEICQHTLNLQNRLNFPMQDSFCKTLNTDLTIQAKIAPLNGNMQVILPDLFRPYFIHSFSSPAVELNLKVCINIDSRMWPPGRDIRIHIDSFQI